MCLASKVEEARDGGRGKACGVRRYMLGVEFRVLYFLRVSVFNILPGSCSLWQGAIVVMSNGRIMSPYAMESSPCSAQVCMVMFNVKGTALGHDAHIVV
jgi:hypothetical protein